MNKLIGLIKIWQIGKTTVFNFILIIPVIDLALGVIVLGLIEWSDKFISFINIGDMISYDI